MHSQNTAAKLARTWDISGKSGKALDRHFFGEIVWPRFDLGPLARAEVSSGLCMTKRYWPSFGRSVGYLFWPMNVKTGSAQVWPICWNEVAHVRQQHMSQEEGRRR